MRSCRELTAEEKQRAWDLYAELNNWAKVAPHFNMGVTAFRNHMEVSPQKRRQPREVERASQARSQATKKRDSALYDPHRDGDPVYDNEVNAAFLGDPPRGRRELLEANAEQTAPPELHPNAKPWHL